MKENMPSTTASQKVNDKRYTNKEAAEFLGMNSEELAAKIGEGNEYIVAIQQLAPRNEDFWEDTQDEKNWKIYTNKDLTHLEEPINIAGVSVSKMIKIPLGSAEIYYCNLEHISGITYLVQETNELTYQYESYDLSTPDEFKELHDKVLSGDSLENHPREMT